MVDSRGHDAARLYAIWCLLAVPVAAAAQPPFNDVLRMVRPTGPECNFTQGSSGKCPGHPPPRWTKRDQDAERVKLVEWFDELDFKGSSKEVLRDPGVRLRIRHVEHSERHWPFNFSNPGDPKQRGLVVARIENLDMSTGVLDKRYGTGRPAGVRREKYFYIVAFDYDPDPDPAHYYNDSYKVSTWRVFAIDTVRLANGTSVRRLEPLDANGTFRMCGMKHDSLVRAEGAKFISCKSQEELSDIFRNNPRLAQRVSLSSLYQAVMPPAGAGTAPRGVGAAAAGSRARQTQQQVATSLQALLDRSGVGQLRAGDAARLTRILYDSYLDPGWMPCGVGCCTADNR
jgi:hypothetical protein